jgi:predicted Fe-Mo cluster-binding NifX family protein
MIVAVPVDARERVYHDNPCTSTMFALYEVSGERQEVRYRHIETRINPWDKYKGQMLSDPVMKACACENALSQNPHHISEHYVLLEAIGKCDVFIVDQYCLNTLYTMKNVGIKIHKIPPFVKTPSEAIEHFIIGTEITQYLRCVREV